MSPVPPWALERIKIAFNAQDAQGDPGAGADLGLNHAQAIVEATNCRLRIFERLLPPAFCLLHQLYFPTFPGLVINSFC
jgi:hypothetical protein